MDGNKKLFDLSSYLLFEDSADSETIDYHHATNNINKIIKNSSTKDEDHHDHDHDHDDALSCSSVLSEDYIVIHDRKRKDRLVHVISDDDDDDDDRFRYLQYSSEDDDDDGEDEGVVNQALKKSKHEEHQESTRSCNNNCGDNNNQSMKLINQREQDKLFWEACLGS